MLLADVGLQPRTREEQHRMMEILEEADEDGSGTYAFEEFRFVARKIRELLHAMELEMHREYARDLGLDEVHFNETVASFQSFDKKGSGKLGLSDVRVLL